MIFLVPKFHMKILKIVLSGQFLKVLCFILRPTNILLMARLKYPCLTSVWRRSLIHSLKHDKRVFILCVVDDISRIKLHENLKILSALSLDVYVWITIIMIMRV